MKIFDSENKHYLTIFNKETADSEIVAQGVKLICTTPPATLILLSGDTDFEPLIKIAKEMGWRVEIWAFKTALTNKKRLLRKATDIKYLDDIFDKIGYTNQ